MSVFEILAILVTLASLLSFLNYHFIKLPTTIGVMLIALGISLALIVAGQFGMPLHEPATRLLKPISFDHTLMQGMLSFLLFAGALHINLNDLHEEKVTVFVLSTVGVLLPPSPERQVILAMTYIIVVFSIAVQGTTIQQLTAHHQIVEAASDLAEAARTSNLKIAHSGALCRLGLDERQKVR